MNLARGSFGAGVGAILLTCGASASPVIDLGGYTGPIQFKFQNYESFTGTPLAVGSMNFGVVKITSIIDPTTGGTLWSPGWGKWISIRCFQRNHGNLRQPDGSE